MIRFATVEQHQIDDYWPAIGPWLVMGSECEGDVWEAFADVEAGRARVWVILDDATVVGAFLTSVIDNGEALDVYGLGGRGILKWGKPLTDAMIEVGKANGCDRVVFKGRKALKRVYPDIREAGQDGPNLYRYERALA